MTIANPATIAESIVELAVKLPKSVLELSAQTHKNVNYQFLFFYWF